VSGAALATGKLSSEQTRLINAGWRIARSSAAVVPGRPRRHSYFWARARRRELALNVAALQAARIFSSADISTKVSRTRSRFAARRGFAAPRTRFGLVVALLF